MIKGGKGGANTCTGLHFENRTSLPQKFSNLKGYSVKEDSLFFKEKLIGKFYKKNALYKFLDFLKVNWRKRISKRLMPDEALLVIKNKTLFIIEMKFQHGPGSVDEKLQTCDFKKKQYSKLFKGTGIKIEYCYVLNDWYKKPEYEDTLSYVRSVGCEYFFEDVPFGFLGLPEPKGN